LPLGLGRSDCWLNCNCRETIESLDFIPVTFVISLPTANI